MVKILGETRSKGFTLIELLVVIAIIGLLSSIVLASLNTARAKAEDAARVSDIKALETAMELYYNDHSSYPIIGTPDWGNYIATLQTILVPNYIGSIPSVLTADGDQYVNNASGSGYSFYVYTAALNAFCKNGVNVNPGWWGPIAACDF